MKFSFLWTIIIAVSVLSALGGCTIEKRLYQRGYHVEWHKRVKSTDETGLVTEKQVSDQIMPSGEKNAETVAVTPEVEEKTTILEETPVLSQTQDLVSGAAENTTVTNSANSDQSPETVEQAQKTKPLLKKMSHRGGLASGFTKGLLMILMGLLLIGMGFLFQNILGVFGTILLIIFGLGGAIMIVVGIVLMILG
ncbi:MAG: hypothetical protein V4604_07040 [Bacteroidota bacterium]